MIAAFGLLEPKVEDGFKKKLEEKNSFVKCVIRVFSRWLNQSLKRWKQNNLHWTKLYVKKKVIFLFCDRQNVATLALGL
jgi:DNA polymerase III delta subunit